jgi:hypothetical protein
MLSLILWGTERMAATLAANLAAMRGAGEVQVCFEQNVKY